MTSLLIFSMRAVGMTNDMVFIMWHLIRHDSTLLTWILNLIIQFISCLYTELAIVKVSHRIRDCVFVKDLKDTDQFLPIRWTPQLSQTCVHSNPWWPVKQELHFLWSGFQWPQNMETQNWSPSVWSSEEIHSWFVALTHTQGKDKLT